MFALCSSMRHKRNKGNFHIPSIILHARGFSKPQTTTNTKHVDSLEMDEIEVITDHSIIPTKEDAEQDAKEDAKLQTKEDAELQTKDTPNTPALQESPSFDHVIQNINLEVSQTSDPISHLPEIDEYTLVNHADDFVVLSEEDLLPPIKPVKCTAIVPYGLIKKAEWRLLKYIVAQLKSLTPRLLAHAIIYYYGGSGGSLMIYLISRALQLGLL